jgi:hypothetical protein
MDDNSVVISDKIAKDLFDIKDEVSIILVKVKKGANVDLVAEEIKEELRKLKDEKEGEESFSSSNF